MEENKELQKEIENSSDRRTFLKKGAVVSVPLVLSAFSRPVLADRCGISGLTSGNVSGHETDQCILGLSPGAYKTPYDGDGTWPSPFVVGDLGEFDTNKKVLLSPGTGTKFHAYFSRTGAIDFGDATMFDILWMNGVTPAPHFVAALLNAYTWPQDGLGGGYVLSKTNVLNLWDEYSGAGGGTAQPLIEDINDAFGYSKYEDFLNSTWT